MSTILQVPRAGLARRSMMPGRLDRARTDEAGFTIVEVLVSAIVVVLIAMASFGAIQSAGRSATETKHRTQAYAIAQQDQAALRTLKISTLSNYSDTHTLTVDSTPYTIVSTGEFISDFTGTQSCSGTSSADYISISSTVTWPSIGTRPPVVIKSIVSPPNGTIGENKGALSVIATDSRSLPLAGLTITGTGPATFADTTDTSGCMLFGNLPDGNYTVTPSSTLTLVDKDGNAPAPQTTSVVAQSTNSVTMQYDRPGTVNASFTVRPIPSGAVVPSASDTAIAYNTGMSVPRKFGTVGTRQSTLSLNNLFPFVSTTSFYAGNCTTNQPPNNSAGLKSLAVPVNGTASTTIQLPALYLTVKSGTGASNPGLPVANAHVVTTDRAAGCGTKRAFTTDVNGKVTEPGATGIGLPWAAYNVCADNGTKRFTQNNVSIKNYNAGTTVTLYLGAAAAQNGVCT